MARGETVFEGLCASSSLANERAAFELAWSPDAYIRSFPVAISYYQYYTQPWLVPSKRLANPLAKRVTIMPKDIQLARRIRGERA